VSLPAEKFTLKGYDFAAQMRLHWSFICQTVPRPSALSAFENWLTARIYGMRGQGWIDRLELNVASRACEILGLRLVEGPQVALSGHDATNWTQYADVGYQVLCRGVSAFETTLSDMLRDGDVDRRFFAKVYGPLTTWLRGSGLGDEFEPLKSVVRVHVFQHFSVRRGVLVLGRPSIGKTGNTQPVAIASLPSQLTALMLSRGLASLDVDKNIAPKGFVTETMVAALKREMAADHSASVQLSAEDGRKVLGHPDIGIGCTSLTSGDVVKRLKITKPTVIYLCKNGFLAQFRHTPFRRDGSVSICSASVADFEKTYVSLGAFAARSICRQGALAIKMKNAGTQMLAMPPKYSRIFWRTDLEAWHH
jgi:hypothetical protein